MHVFYEEMLASKELYKGRVFTVTLDEARLENGRSVPREVVHHPGGAAVVALNEKGEVALVRQYRYAAGKELLEIPAGKMEPGEDPRETALRELREEAGLAAEHFSEFGRIIPTGAYCSEVIYIFLATELSPVPQNLDPDEFLSVFWMDLDEAVRLVLSGEIDDAKTVSALLRVKMLLDKGELRL